jgi:hypothetical protein
MGSFLHSVAPHPCIFLLLRFLSRQQGGFGNKESSMSNDNRISAVMPDEDVNLIQLSLTNIRHALPFLVTLSGQERRELPKMGPKSVGFDEKCTTYMTNRPEFVPGFVDPVEVQKDRALRAQLLRFASELETLTNSVDDTLQLVSSEIWMADLAYYQTAREAAHRGRAGAQDVYDALSTRFPGAPTGKNTAVKSPIHSAAPTPPVATA